MTVSVSPVLNTFGAVKYFLSGVAGLRLTIAIRRQGLCPGLCLSLGPQQS